MANRLSFQDAEKARDAIDAKQLNEITSLYDKWADEVGKRAEYYKNKTTTSSSVMERQARELQRQLRATAHEVAKELHGVVKNNIYLVAESVVKCNNEWLASLGFDARKIGIAFSHVPDKIVRRLVSGQIYKGGWNLSTKIWSNNESVMKDAYTIVAKGMAENATMYDIAKNLESYVRPEVHKPWNPKIWMKNNGTGKWEYKRIYRKQVDYSAQRLGRTLVQHGYQTSFIETTKGNPFIKDYVWHANGSRPCSLCKMRDGNHYSKNDLPMDHPNGMCVMEPDVSETLVDDIANWYNSPTGTYPEIDRFATDINSGIPL